MGEKLSERLEKLELDRGYDVDHWAKLSRAEFMDIISQVKAMEGKLADAWDERNSAHRRWCRNCAHSIHPVGEECDGCNAGHCNWDPIRGELFEKQAKEITTLRNLLSAKKETILEMARPFIREELEKYMMEKGLLPDGGDADG